MGKLEPNFANGVLLLLLFIFSFMLVTEIFQEYIGLWYSAVVSLVISASLIFVAITEFSDLEPWRFIRSLGWTIFAGSVGIWGVTSYVAHFTGGGPMPIFGKNPLWFGACGLVMGLTASLVLYFKARQSAKTPS